MSTDEKPDENSGLCGYCGCLVVFVVVGSWILAGSPGCEERGPDSSSSKYARPSPPKTQAHMLVCADTGSWFIEPDDPRVLEAERLMASLAAKWGESHESIRGKTLAAKALLAEEGIEEDSLSLLRAYEMFDPPPGWTENNTFVEMVAILIELQKESIRPK